MKALNSNPLRRIFVLAGGKGGVGKTMGSQALVDHLRGQGLAPLVVETDTSNQDVYKPCSKLDGLHCVLLDLDRADGWIELVNLLEASPERPVVINTASRNNDGVEKFGSLLDQALEPLHSELIVFWMINRQRDSLELLRKFMKTVSRARIHVVRNEWFSPAAKFQLYEGSEIRKEIEAAGGHSLNFPDLADRVADALYIDRQPIELAVQQMPLGNRTELQRWRKAVGIMFAQALA